MNSWRRWRKKRRDAWWKRFDKEHRWDRLARYNNERSAGIVHTREYVELMKLEKKAFDMAQEREMIAKGYRKIEDQHHGQFWVKP